MISNTIGRSRWACRAALSLGCLTLCGAFVASQAGAAQKLPFTVAGTYVESCSCAPPCACEMIGLAHGCQGVGAVAFSSGRYMNTDLAGAKVAYATLPGSWVRLYVDVRQPAQERAAEAIGRAIFSAFGKIEAVRKAKVALSGSNGKYTVTVDGGETMKFVTEPVIGGDKRTPIEHSNVANPIVPSFYQGKTVSATYKDGERSFTLEKGTNSYFTHRMKSSGKI